MRYVTTIDNREYLVEILDEQHIAVDGVLHTLNFGQVGSQPVYSLLVDGQSFEAHVLPEEESWQTLIRGRMYTARVEDEREKRLRAALGGSRAEQEEFHLKAPMPGLVVAVPVVEGQTVGKGDVLLILESMKMQNELKSPRAGVVARMRVNPGDRVEKKQTMLSVM